MKKKIKQFSNNCRHLPLKKKKQLNINAKHANMEMATVPTLLHITLHF
jgi:hypothetical protein